jgi:hypothetical protein
MGSAVAVDRRADRRADASTSVSERDPAAASAAVRRIWAEQRAQGQKWVRFIDGLVVEFGIPDRNELIVMLSIAEGVYQVERDKIAGEAEGFLSQREAEALALDELEPVLWKTVELIQQLSYRLAVAIAGASDGTESRTEDDLHALRMKLAEVGRAASQVPRQRRRRGEKASVNHAPLRELMEVVAGYWKGDLGRAFTQNHTSLGWDGDRPKRKAGAAVNFAYAIIEHVAPGHGKDLRTIAREYTGDYGK